MLLKVWFPIRLRDHNFNRDLHVNLISDDRRFAQHLQSSMVRDDLPEGSQEPADDIAESEGRPMGLWRVKHELRSMAVHDGINQPSVFQQGVWRLSSR